MKAVNDRGDGREGEYGTLCTFSSYFCKTETALKIAYSFNKM